MAKVTAPILSISARGQIGKSQVYSSWRGVAYARQRVVPANPQSTAQTLTRTLFASLSGLWKNAPTLLTDVWNAFASGKPLTGRNAFMGANTKAMRGQSDRSDFIGSNGARGGPACTAVVASQVGASDPVDVTITSPPTPTGWTLVSAVAIAILDGTPGDPVPFPIIADDNESPNEDGDTVVSLTGFAASDDIVVSGWLTWTKPDGSTAYGASIQDTYTVT